jgi:hypothetical protein
MKVQAGGVHTRSLGPFLALILNSPATAHSVRRCQAVWRRQLQVAEAATGKWGEPTANLQPRSLNCHNVGPLTKLILRVVEESVARRRSEAEQGRAWQPLCVRVRAGQ